MNRMTGTQTLIQLKKTNCCRFFLFLGEKCVHIAAEKNHIEILKHLSCIGADINARVSLTHHMIMA